MEWKLGYQCLVAPAYDIHAKLWHQVSHHGRQAAQPCCLMVSVKSLGLIVLGSDSMGNSALLHFLVSLQALVLGMVQSASMCFWSTNPLAVPLTQHNLSYVRLRSYRQVS